MKTTFDWKPLWMAASLWTATHMLCPAREKEPHVPEWPASAHRTQVPNWIAPPIAASGYLPGGNMY
jgi:hypothetical protein